MEKSCAKCPLRAKYDNKPNSIMGKFWHWHINFCPGWKSYYNTLSAEDRQATKERYGLKK